MGGEQAIFEDCDTLQAVMDQEFAKSFTPGPEKMGRWTKKKEGRKQRLVARANPRDCKLACQWKCIMGIISWLCVLAWKVRDHL